MYALDFEYDGIYLSDFNCIICDFNFSNGATTADAGAKITFNTVPRNRGRKHSLVGTQFDTCIEATFDICKDPDIDDSKYFTNDEYRDLVRWLNRSDGFHTFRIFPIEEDVETCYYNASFNIEKIKIMERICGIRLTMTTDKPYGFGEEQISTITTTRTQTLVERNVKDVSDDIGDIYPSIKIVCNASGNITINNITNGSKFTIKNCTMGETITVDGDTLFIKSSRNRNVWDGFSYDYLKLTNTLKNRVNKIVVSLPSVVTISYRPIIKDAP